MQVSFQPIYTLFFPLSKLISNKYSNSCIRFRILNKNKNKKTKSRRVGPISRMEVVHFIFWVIMINEQRQLLYDGFPGPPVNIRLEVIFGPDYFDSHPCFSLIGLLHLHFASQSKHLRRNVQTQLNLSPFVQRKGLFTLNEWGNMFV